MGISMGSSSKKPKAPPAPDYAGAAQAQGDANLRAARASGKLSNPSFSNPLGSRDVTFGYGGDPDAVHVKDSLTPQGQQRWDQEQRIIGNLGGIAEQGLNRVGESMEKPFGFSSATDLQNKAEGALMSRLEPSLNRDREALRTQLINQGFRIGTEGYDRGMERADQQANDARTQAVIKAMQTRPQALQEELSIRNQPLNEVNALRTGSQVSMPQFQSFSGSTAAPAPIMAGTQAQGAANQQQYATDVGLYNAKLQGLTSMIPFGFG